MTLSILLFFGIGLLAGFIASTLLGPINMVIANKVLSDNDWSMHWFVSGVVLVDTAVAVLALWGFQNWMIQLASNNIIVGIGAGFIIAIGIFGFLNLKQPQKDSHSGVGDFVKGVLLCGLNPGFFIYWIFVADQISISQGGLSAAVILSFGMGVALGNILWFSLFRYLLSKGSAKFGFNAIKLIRRTISIALVGFGLFTLIHHFVY